MSGAHPPPRGEQDAAYGPSGDGTLAAGSGRDLFVLNGYPTDGPGRQRLGGEVVTDLVRGADRLSVVGQIRRPGGRLVERFADLDTNGDGRVDDRDAGAALDDGDLTLAFVGGSVTLRVVAELGAADVIFNVFGPV